jgi:carboxylesterase type B
MKVLGRYVAGRASLYDGEDVINQSNRGIVVVVIQYRLGVFGTKLLSKNKASL